MTELNHSNQISKKIIKYQLSNPKGNWWQLFNKVMLLYQSFGTFVVILMWTNWREKIPTGSHKKSPCEQNYLKQQCTHSTQSGHSRGTQQSQWTWTLSSSVWKELARIGTLHRCRRTRPSEHYLLKWEISQPSLLQAKATCIIHINYLMKICRVNVYCCHGTFIWGQNIHTHHCDIPQQNWLGPERRGC